MGIRFGMVVLYVRELERSIAFYRALGLDVADPHPGRPVSASKLSDGVTLIIATDEVARRFDSGWTRPEGGYQQLIEFFLDDEAAVDAAWAELTAAGYPGRTAPGHLIGPYAAMVDDPDGNVVLLTHEAA